MQQNHILEEAGYLIEAIAEQQLQIRQHQGAIPQIELDIILGNISKLYDQLSRLRKFHCPPDQIIPQNSREFANPEPAHLPIAEKKEDQPVKQAVSVSREKTPIVSFVVRPSFVNEVIKAESAPILPEIKVSSQDQSTTTPVAIETTKPSPGISNITERETMPKQEPVAAAVEAPASPPLAKKGTVQTMGLFDHVMTVAEKYDEQPTLHDKISKNKPDSSLGKKLQQKPVADLKKSIGINEKFSFINELFDGDLNSYNHAIDTLNLCNGLDEATRILHEELSAKYNWDTGSKSFINLQNLLGRRFTK